MDSTKTSLSNCIAAYCRAVREDDLPRAYRGILSALMAFKAGWESAHPEDSVGALYQGYLDMSFVAVAPAAFGARRLKISLVFLHDTGLFSLWLTAGNRAIQAQTSQELAKKPLGSYSLSELKPGVDAIISQDITQPYAFDEPERFTSQLIAAAERFLSDMKFLLEA